MTRRQQKFIDSYDGDIKKAAQKAGLSYSYARRLIRCKEILTAIKNRIDTELRPKNISTRQERQRFWSDVMNDSDVSMRNRLRASELMGKSEMDFPNKLEVAGADGGPLPPIKVVVLGKSKRKK